MLLTSLGAAGWELPPVVRRGEPVCPGRRASAARPWMAHRRVPWDKRVNRGNLTQEGELVAAKHHQRFSTVQYLPLTYGSPPSLHRVTLFFPSPISSSNQGNLEFLNMK